MSAIKANKELVKTAQHITSRARDYGNEHGLCEIESKDGDWYKAFYNPETDTYEILKAPKDLGECETICTGVGKKKAEFELVSILQNQKQILW